MLLTVAPCMLTSTATLGGKSDQPWWAQRGPGGRPSMGPVPVPSAGSKACCVWFDCSAAAGISVEGSLRSSTSKRGIGWVNFWIPNMGLGPAAPVGMLGAPPPPPPLARAPGANEAIAPMMTSAPPAERRDLIPRFFEPWVSLRSMFAFKLLPMLSGRFYGPAQWNASPGLPAATEAFSLVCTAITDYRFNENAWPAVASSPGPAAPARSRAACAHVAGEVEEVVHAGRAACGPDHAHPLRADLHAVGAQHHVEPAGPVRRDRHFEDAVVDFFDLQRDRRIGAVKQGRGHHRAGLGLARGPVAGHEPELRGLVEGEPQARLEQRLHLDRRQSLYLHPFEDLDASFVLVKDLQCARSRALGLGLDGPRFGGHRRARERVDRPEAEQGQAGEHGGAKADPARASLHGPRGIAMHFHRPLGLILMLRLTSTSPFSGTSIIPSAIPMTPRRMGAIAAAGSPRTAAMTQYCPGAAGVNGTSKTPSCSARAGSCTSAASAPWRSENETSSRARGAPDELSLTRKRSLTVFFFLKRVCVSKSGASEILLAWTGSAAADARGTAASTSASPQSATVGRKERKLIGSFSAAARRRRPLRPGHPHRRRRGHSRPRPAPGRRLPPFPPPADPFRQSSNCPDGLPRWPPRGCPGRRVPRGWPSTPIPNPRTACRSRSQAPPAATR